jgi:hypothetical protein
MTKIDTVAEKVFIEKLDKYKTDKIANVLNTIARLERDLIGFSEEQKAKLNLKKEETEKTVKDLKESIEIIKEETFVPNN